ncbi:MAG TPA: SynChlorMet cassette radical SAM/SPASM protein ScmE [Syntrophales bacterium]|nr:SynChlorMet cassette radical SAM/SPASM protein ScmE [Syntrophales bacterium]HRT60844.1 SynChlorMet cassette radical SAM/SPASM protein ScmE [Syntrophales bacterium]
MRVMLTPRSLDVSITNRCNLRCAYCYHFDSADDTGTDLPAEDWLRFFEECGRCAVMTVSLAGGEPLIREDIREIIEGIAANRMRFTIATNGTLITEEMAAFIAATDRCDGIQVSIDGSMPLTHDSMRGHGSFRKAVRGIRILQRQGVPVTVRVTIHRENVHDLEGAARLLLEEIGIPSFSTNSASYMGLCRQNSERVQLTVEERTLAMASLLGLCERYEGRISATAGPLAEARMYAEMEDARKQGLDRLPDRGFLTGCGGMMSKMGVRADGVMIPCGQLPSMELGRINRDRLEDVWLHHPEMNRLRSRALIPLSDFVFCDGCPYLNYCTGSCPALAYEIVGDPYHPAPNDCYRRFLEAGGKVPSMEGCAS